MSAAIPTSSSSQDVPPPSPPPDIPRDSGPDPTPTVITTSELEIVVEIKPDESVTSLPPAPARPQSPEQPPGPVHRPERVESHAPALRTPPARPHPVSLTERDRPLPAIPPNATSAPPREEASLRPRVVSDPVNAHRRDRRSEPPPARPLDLPGAVVVRRRPATHAGDYDPPFGSPPRIRSPLQSIDGYPPGSVRARLAPTLREAEKVREGAAMRAIALQVILGALTTALGASLHGNSIRVSVAVLGSSATLVASYLARTRGSSEPESSYLREQALSHFIRRLRSFILDSGWQEGHDQVVENFRNELERLLNPSDPDAKKNSLIFDPKLEVKIDNEAIDIFDPNKDYRARPRAQKETAEGCHCDDGVASNSRKQKGKGKVVDSSKKNKKPGRDGDGDGRTGAGADADADAD